MKKMLLGLVAALVLAGAGVGGTLGVQTLDGGESRDCRDLGRFVTELLARYRTQQHTTHDDWDYLHTVLGVRADVCRW